VLLSLHVVIRQHPPSVAAIVAAAVLCCAVLCCAVLCCAVLCCAVLCCAVLCCAVQARRWVKEAVESGKYKPRLVMPVAAAAV
jgi:hypothetical protein